MNGQVDTGALEEFLRGKGLLRTPSAIQPVAQLTPSPFEKPPSVIEQERPAPSYGALLVRFLENKGLSVDLPEAPIEDPMMGWKPPAVTKPEAPTREEVTAGVFAPLPAGLEIPTPEERPSEILERTADYVPPPSWWQEIKDLAFLVKQGDLNAYSIAARGLLKGPTGGLVDPVKLIEKISGQEGFAEEYDREVSRRVQERVGYTPKVGVKALAETAEFAGYLIPFSKILKGASVAARWATKVPVLQAAARAEITGTLVGLTQTPEDDGVLKRLKQIPPSVAFFTVFETGRLTAQQVLKIVRYNRAAKFYKKVDWDAVPDPPGEPAYTAKQMQDLFIKFRGNIDPATKLPKGITPEELKILEFFKETGAWKEAAKRGWMPPEGFDPARPAMETGIPAAMPRRPRFADIFRRPPFAPFEPRPGAPPAAEPTPMPPEAPPVRPAAAARPEAPPPTERPVERPRGREGVPAVVVDVTPKPEGGWRYKFDIPVGEVTPPETVIPWKPEAKPLGLPEPKPPVPKEPKAKVFQNPLYQFINYHFSGVKPNPDYPYQTLKQVLPFDLIRKDGAAMDVIAQAMKSEFPNIEGDADLMNALEKMADTKAAVKFRDITTGEELEPPQEFFDEQLDRSILDTIEAGREADLSPTETERARELLDMIPPEEAEKLGLDEGMVRIRELMRKRREKADKEMFERIVAKDVEKAPRLTEEEIKFDVMDGTELSDTIDAMISADADKVSIKVAKKVLAEKLPQTREDWNLVAAGRWPGRKPPRILKGKITPVDVKARPTITLKPEEFKLRMEEEVKPKKPVPKKEEPRLIKKEELIKPKAKYPEGFSEAGWMSVPKYQGTLTAARKAAAAGFDVEYGPIGKEDRGYVHITNTRPAGKKGKVVLKSRAAIPPKFETKAEQLGLDEEVSGDLFAKAAPGVKEEDLLTALDELNIPAEHRGEVSLSVLKNFDPKKGVLTNYIRRIMSAISKRRAPEKVPPVKEEPAPERGPADRFAKAEAEVRIVDAIKKATKNEKEIDIVRRRILDEESFEAIGRDLKVSRQRVQKVFTGAIEKMKKDPDVIKMLEDRWKEHGMGAKPDFKEMATTFNKYFTSSKGMSKDIDAANDKRISNPLAEMFLTTLEGKEVDRWIRKNDNAGLRQQVKELLTGEMSFDNIALPENVPEEAIRSLRKRIDDLSTLIMAHGGLKEQTMATFESGIGKYLGTFYRLHEYNELNKGKFIKKYWDPPKEARDRFAARLKSDDPGAFGDFTNEQMDNFLDAMLRGEDYIYKRSGRTKRVPTDHYKQKKDLSPEWIEFAGVITDPVWLALKTVTKQSTIAYNAQFLNTLEDNPQTSILITHDIQTARDRAWLQHRLPDDYSYGRLRGAWVHPELDSFIRGEINPQVSATERVIMKFIMNPFKATKTIGSVPTHARNITGGGVMFSFLMRCSILNPLNSPYYLETFRIWWYRKGKTRNEWAELIRAGITETQFYKGEIPAFFNELLKLDPPDWPEKIHNWLIKKPIDLAGEIYNFEDVLYRGAAHLKNIKHYKKTVQDSVDDINLGSPNYRKMPIAVDWLRKYPVFGPFISFRYNVAKILANQAIKAGKDIGSKDSKRKVDGWLRLYRLAFALGLPFLLAKISHKVFDVEERQIKKLEKLYPPYRRGGIVVYFRGKEGQLKGYDFTYTYPTGDMIKAINNLKSGDVESFTEAMQLFAHPIFDAFSIVIQGRDPYWGTKIARPVMRRATELVKLLWLPQSAPIPSIQGLIEAIKTGKIGGNLRVGSLTTYQIETLIQAYQKQEDRYGRIRKLPEELKGFFTGVRTWDVDPEAMIAQYIRVKQFELNEAERAWKSWERRNTKAAYWQQEEQQSLYEIKRDKIYRDIEDVSKLLEEISGGAFRLRKRR